MLTSTTGAAIFIFVHDGTLGVMLGMESVSATGAVFYGLVRVGRWWRGVKPPTRATPYVLTLQFVTPPQRLVTPSAA